MGRSLNKLTLQGFKSFREVEDFKLERRNVLIGANGAGKSNFIEFFRMLRALALDGLQEYINQRGGGDGFLYQGPQLTREIAAQLDFGQNRFSFKLHPTVSGDLIVHEVGTYWDGYPHWSVSRRSSPEANITAWKDDSSVMWPKSRSREAHVYEAISSWIVYHFHDTSMTAPMRRDADAPDYRELRAQGENLAPFLAHLRDQHPDRYQRIRETIQIIAPFFDDFLLEVRTKGPREVLRLEWRQKGSTFPFQPWHLSDGTIRFIALTTALLQPAPPTTIVIDEPELGLHPVALRVLAALIHEASERTQLVISTQSPGLVDHFDPEDIVVVDRENGASTLRRLDPADLERWLEDYTLGDLIEKNVIETDP
ncbi:MAG: AAA family ATPase [Myxococcales bacterium]|nr:AAA family ATPase [Myxococcales bacterium]MCB9700790.1 AAA family ATPase [Myxococcales bacterium]